MWKFINKQNDKMRCIIKCVLKIFRPIAKKEQSFYIWDSFIIFKQLSSDRDYYFKRIIVKILKLLSFNHTFYLHNK